MPNVDERAKAWQEQRSRRFGQAVAARRNDLGLTAVQLSERTRAIGYPMTRSTIARIEGNHRAGKIDLAEIVTLAAALDTAPGLLLFPDLVDGAVEVVPDRVMSSSDAWAWFSANGDLDPAANAVSAEVDSRNREYHRAISSWQLSLDVTSSRVVLWAARIGGRQDEIAEALIGLERAKSAARRAGLIVDDDRDAVTASIDNPPDGQGGANHA